MAEAPLEPQAGAPLKQSADRQAARRSLSRWAVHLGLLASAAAALGTLDLLHVRIAIHTDVGLAFVALVVVHLAQRPRALARIATRTVRAGSPSSSTWRCTSGADGSACGGRRSDSGHAG